MQRWNYATARHDMAHQDSLSLPLSKAAINDVDVYMSEVSPYSECHTHLEVTYGRCQIVEDDNNTSACSAHHNYLSRLLKKRLMSGMPQPRLPSPEQMLLMTVPRAPTLSLVVMHTTLSFGHCCISIASSINLNISSISSWPWLVL